jgi:hypothetical protein
MTPEAPMVDDCFSEAPLAPRRLSFSQAQPSHGLQEEIKGPEAPSKLFEGLAKAFLLMVGRRARLDLRMEVTKARVDQLNGHEGGQLVVPPDICGDFTIVRCFGLEPISANPMNGLPVMRLRRVINKDIEASSIPAPNHSLASDIDGGDITVTVPQNPKTPMSFMLIDKFLIFVSSHSQSGGAFTEVLQIGYLHVKPGKSRP